MTGPHHASNAERGFLLALLPVLLLAAGPAQSAFVSYFSQSSARGLPDGINYLQVTIADGVDGAIDFTVTPLEALLNRASDGLDIRAFAFNVADGFDLRPENITGLPDNYDARGTSRMDGFGRFDMTLFGTGPTTSESLQFSIVGIEGDTPSTYMDLSSGTAGKGNTAFAARVRNLFAETVCSPDRKCTPQAIPSAFIGGGVSQVPLPATAWLLLTGFAGILARARRRAS